MNKTTHTQSDLILFLFFSQEMIDEKLMSTFPYGRGYLTFAKHHMNTHALISCFHTNGIHNNDRISYVIVPPMFRHLGFITSLVECMLVSRQIRSIAPALIVLSGAVSKRDLRLLFPLLNPKQKFAVMMATPSVVLNPLMRFYLNRLLQFNMLFFSNLIIGKDWRFDSLKLPQRKIRIITHGYYDHGYSPKDFSVLKLVYIGVCRGRGIDITIQGLALFLRDHPEAGITYEIISKDNPEYLARLGQLVKDYGLEQVVKIHGYLPQDEASEVIRRCNIGIAYLPINNYYGNESAKTIEYLIAGLPVITTPNRFKCQYINDSNGVIHDDSPEAFALALHTAYQRRFTYRPEEIRDLHLHLSIDSTTRDSKIPLLKSML